jgi:hypothetical protein
MPRKRSDFIRKAKEAEKIAKQIYREQELFLKESYRDGRKGYTDDILKKINDLKIPLARAYEDAAKNYLAANKIGKADKYYLLATREYGALIRSKYTDPDKKQEFYAHCANGRKVRDILIKIRIGKWRGLEGKVAVMLSAISLMMGLYLLSPNITGNAIGFNHPTANIFGVVLLIAGAVGSFFWLKYRNH